MSYAGSQHGCNYQRSHTVCTQILCYHILSSTWGVEVQSRLHVILQIAGAGLWGCVGWELGILITSMHLQTRPSDPSPHPLLGPDSTYPANIFPCPGPNPRGQIPWQPQAASFWRSQNIQLHSWILRKEKGGAAWVEHVLGA